MDAILWIALCSNIADFGSSRRSNSSLLLSFTRVTIRPRRHSKLPGGQYLPVSLHLVVTVSHLSTVRRTCISTAMSSYVSRPTSLRNPHNSSRACRSKRDHCLDGSSMSSITVSTPSRRSMRSFCRLDVVSSSARLGRKAYKLAYTSNLILRIIDIQAYLQELVQGLDYVFRVQRAYIYRPEKNKTQNTTFAESRQSCHLLLGRFSEKFRHLDSHPSDCICNSSTAAVSICSFTVCQSMVSIA
jgi:hypothetical protein